MNTWSLHSDFPRLRLASDTSTGNIERINAQRGRREIGKCRANLGSDGAPPDQLFIAVAWFFAEARRSAGHAGWSWLWIAVILQIGLGAWTIWSAKAADVATAHMALGALSLLVGAVLAFRLFCGARIRDFVLPDDVNRGLIERVA
jgi:hypothetical protein